jgi:hypothetical protein
MVLPAAATVLMRKNEERNQDTKIDHAIFAIIFLAQLFLVQNIAITFFGLGARAQWQQQRQRQ